MLLSEIKKRVILVISSTLAILFLLILRTFYLMLFKGEELSVLTENQYKISESISNINYMLQDYNGKEMLNYITKYYFVVDVDNYIKNNRETDITKLNTLIYTLRNYNKSYDLTELLYNSTNKRLYYEIDKETYRKISNMKDIKGVYCYMKSDVDRTGAWKYENMLTSPLDLGNKKKDKNSIEGFVMEKTANNKYPLVSFEKDVNGIISGEKYIVPENNVNVKLTTDKDIEDKIEKILQEEELNKYDQIGVVLMESDTGKIKAMVQRDDWKPNIILCSATENGFEPGSIFKTIIEEIALEKDRSLLNKTIVCQEEKKNHGTLGMEEAYIQSCNTYFSILGAKVGFKSIYSMARNQGFYDKVLNFSGNNEATGDIVASKSINLKKVFGNDFDKVKNVKLAQSTESMLGMGQSMRITPLHALGIVNTVVNDGYYIKPYLIDSLVSNDGQKLVSYGTTKSRVFSKSTALTIKSHMNKVVKDSKGTGKQAYVEGIECGGKTGTNTRYVTNEGVSTKYSDGWFIGYVKDKGKYYSMVVFVQNIDVENQGAGSTAAPIFREVVEAIFKP